MDTQTNSVINRGDGDGDEALVSRMVYENESLKIQIESLREKLESTGVLKLDEIRSENEDLRNEVERLRVQLTEKVSQLDLYRSSNDRFSDINQSLSELLKQVQTQRSELAEMKSTTREKDLRIEELSGQLKQSEEALSQMKAECAALTQSSAQATEREQLQTRLDEVKTEMETLKKESVKEIEELQNRLRESQKQLLAIKEDAVAKSRVRGERVGLQEQEMVSLREREANTQRQLIELQKKVETMTKECFELREARADLIREHQTQLDEQRRLAAAAARQPVDLNSKEVKSHVEEAVRKATEGVERRLREQVEHNVSILSRMALVEKESEALLQSKGVSTKEMSVVKERVDMRSRHNNARTTMQRRVAEVLSKGELSKGDIEVLLQEMLDYQEETDQEYRTLLVIKDIQLEEKERTLQGDVKRLTDENSSLMKQLRHAAVGGFTRESHNSIPAASGGGDADERYAAEHGPTTTLGVRTGGASLPGASMRHVVPSQAPLGSASPRPGTRASSYDRPPQQSHVQHSPEHFSGNLWSDVGTRKNTTSLDHPQQTEAVATSHADPNKRPVLSAPYASTRHAASSAPASGTEADPNANVIVRCPACTYEQRYGNLRCEICNATLYLH